MEIKEIVDNLKDTFVEKDQVQIILDKLDALEKSYEKKPEITQEAFDEVKYWKGVFRSVKATGDLDTIGNSGDIIPTQVYNKIMEAAAKTDWVRRDGTVVNLAYKENIPVVNTGATAYVVADGSAPSLSTLNLDVKKFESKIIAVASIITNALIASSNTNILQVIYSQFGRAIGVIDRKMAITGNGTTEWEGLQNATISTVTAAATHTAITDIDYDDLVDLITAVGDEYRYDPNMRLIMNPAVFKVIMKLKDVNGLPIFDLKAHTIEGVKVIEEANMPTTGTTNPVIYFGNMKDYWIVDRQGAKMISTNVGKELVLNQQTLLYMNVLCDGHLLMGDGWAGLKLSAS